MAKNANQFARCALSIELDEVLKVTGDKQTEMTNLKKRKIAHVAMIMRARQEYRKRQDRAILYFDIHCPIIIDGTVK